jgi:hypothetical protein
MAAIHSTHPSSSRPSPWWRTVWGCSGVEVRLLSGRFCVGRNPTLTENKGPARLQDLAGKVEPPCCNSHPLITSIFPLRSTVLITRLESSAVNFISSDDASAERSEAEGNLESASPAYLLLLTDHEEHLILCPSRRLTTCSSP